MYGEWIQDSKTETGKLLVRQLSRRTIKHKMCKMSQSLVLVWWGKGSLEEAYVTDSDRASDLLQENKIKVVKDVERQLC